MREPALFFAHIRPLGGGYLRQAQVDGCNRLLGWASRSAVPLPHAAYVLATAWHETHATMQPVRETRAASDAVAIRRLDRAFAAGRLPSVREPYWRPDEDGKAWFGRGYVQLTHKRNYRRMSQLIGVDLVADPSLALDADIAAHILFLGMQLGSFTGQALADHISADGSACDYVAARGIVNGTDRAETVASHARVFEAALSQAGYGAPAGIDSNRKQSRLRGWQ